MSGMWLWWDMAGWYAFLLFPSVNIAATSHASRSINTFRPGRNGWHAADTIFVYIATESKYTSIKCHWKLTVDHHWFRWWLGTEHAIKLSLNLWWPNSYTGHKASINLVANMLILAMCHQQLHIGRALQEEDSAVCLPMSFPVLLVIYLT